MNKKLVLLVLVSASLLLWMLSSLSMAFVKAVPEDIGVEEKCLTKQDFANVASTVNVVFEEAHNSFYSISDGYSEFADYLVAHEYAVSTIDSGTTIDSGVLAPVDVLVIVTPQNNYSTSEIGAIETWVKGGGKLLLISDWGSLGEEASTIAMRFNIDLKLDTICDSDENVDGKTYWPCYYGANLLTHAITAGVYRVEMYAGDGIISAPVDEIPLIVTDSDETPYWYSDNSQAKNVSVMSALDGGTTGSGRLVIITDCGLWSNSDTDDDDEINFYDSDNEILALNTIDWLAGFERCSFNEYFYSVDYTPFDSDGDGYNDAVEVKMDVDTTCNGTLTVEVDAFLRDPYNNTVDLDFPQWSITRLLVEYGYAYLYVPSDSPEGWYDVSLYLWDQCSNYEGYRYDSDVAYLYPPGVEYVLTIQMPYPGVKVNVDGINYTTDADKKVQVIVSPGSCTVEVPTDIPTGFGSQGVFVQWSDGNSSNPRTIFVNNNLSLTAEYMTQYYLIVGSSYSTPGGAGWYDSGITAYATLNTDIVDHGNGTRRVFTHWSGDASGTNYAQSDPIYMDEPKTAIANWKTQYQVTFAQTGLDSTAAGTVLTVNGDTKTFLDFPNTMWVDDGDSISYSYSGAVSSSTSGKSFSLVDITGPDSPISVTGPATVTGNYETRHEYYLTVTSPHGSPTPESGWFEAGKPITVSVTSPVSGPSDTRYICTGWTGTGSVPTSGTTTSVTFTIDEPSSITWNWKTQYYLTMDAGSGTVTPSSGWYDAGSTVQISATAPSATSGEQYVWDGWTGTGTGSYSGMNNPASITMNGPITETAVWRREYPLSSSYIPPLTFSAETIEIGKTITVSGSITPALETTVTLTYTKPDGSTFNKTVTSSSDGTFRHTYKPDADGTWSVKASWPGDTDHYGATSETKEFTVKPVPPLSWDMLQVVLAVVGIVLTVTIVGAAWIGTHRKRGHIKDLLDQIDDAFFRFQRNSRRCEAELYRLKDIVLEEYKSGVVTEASYTILNERIDDYLSKLS